MTMNPEPLSYRVSSIYEDESKCVITLRRTAWEIDSNPESDETVAIEPAEPGQPGAFWSDERVALELVLSPEQSVMFDVGRHYVLALTEIVDAPRSEYEPA